MDLNRRDKIKAEFKKAEEYLDAAELLQKHGLFSPAVTSSYYCALHAATAAFFTVGFRNPHGERFVSFTDALKRFSSKLDPLIERFYGSRKEWAVNTAHEYTESETHLRVYQARDFLLEVKDFLRRTVRT